MANLISIIGSTGSGKSTSVKTLNPEETYIINVLNKPLPFRGSKKMYNTENKNMYYATSAKDIIGVISNINSKASHIKNIIIDDVGFIMSIEFFDKINQKGYEKFTSIANNMQSLIDACKSFRDDLNIVFMFHDELDETGGEKKIKTVGKLLDSQYNPLATVSIALFTDVRYNKEGGGIFNPKYGFITNRTMSSRGIEVPSKSPDGMFDELFIENDLDFVIKKSREYYE